MIIKKNNQNQNRNGLTSLVCDHDQKGMVTDVERGEIICSPCGQVMTEGISSDSRSTHTLDGFLSNSQTGPKSSLTIYDKGLNTNIGARNIDFAGRRISSKTILKFKSMRVWDSRSKSKASGRNLISALVLLDGVKQKLGLSNAIAEHVAFTYRKASTLGLIRGRGTAEVMAASVYAACRENGIPWSLDEVANTLNITKKRLSSCYRILIDRLDIKPELANPLDCLSKFCSVLEVKEKTKRCAFDILMQANSKRILSGSKPAVVCAGALYIACIANNENIPQTRIAEKTLVSSPSIRKALSVLNKALSVV
ncbi:transcription initiation factor IIB [Nitrosopumilus sp.]|uniref:transcription initiation factor IIB n=1 Tax=Nitrosopumilus sp. TaxID=2024843 RepID=UPI003B5A9E06